MVYGTQPHKINEAPFVKQTLSVWSEMCLDRSGSTEEKPSKAGDWGGGPGQGPNAVGLVVCPEFRWGPQGGGLSASGAPSAQR